MASYRALYAAAKREATAAMAACTPVPMVVGQSATLFGTDVDPTKPRYFVEGGVCGFASVRVKPGNCALANWLKKQGLARRSDYGGVLISIPEGGQSLERKVAYGNALANVLRESGADVYCESRMD